MPDIRSDGIMPVMARTPNKPTNEPKADRHKPSRQARIPIKLAELLQEVAEEERSEFSEQVIIAVREYLRGKNKLRPT